MERNAVAAFLLMLRNFLQGHPVNQESLMHCQGPAIIGALLRKVRPAGAGGEGTPSSDQGAVGGTKPGCLMPSVREGLLGEVAFERRGRVGPRGSGEVPAQAGAGHPHSRLGACTSEGREPPEGLEQAGCLCPSACAGQGGNWEA